MSPARTSWENQPDLTTCDREAIHIPGSVQEHGILLSLREPDLTTLQVSASVETLAGLIPSDVLGRSLDQLLDPASLAAVRQRLASRSLDNAPSYLPPLRFAHQAGQCEAILHRCDGVLILQLEPAPAEGPIPPYELYDSIQSTMLELGRASTVRKFCQLAAEQVRRFTGFDRVMVYKFLPDDSGRVIAESRRADLEPYLGLHYPASDIPKQARELYVKSWLRFAGDVYKRPAPLLPVNNPDTNRPLDLSYTALRSLSPVHAEYLRNIGVQASLSLSLILDGRLWGLVACHHQSPKVLSHSARVACEFLAHTLSLQMGAKEDAENFEYRSRMESVRHRLTARMADSEPYHLGLIGQDVNLLHALNASGAATAIGGEITLLGQTPTEPQVAALVRWLGETADEPIFATDYLASVHPPAIEFQDTAAGVLGVRLSQQKPEFLLWFRPAVSQTVTWAGDPNKPVEAAENGGLRLSPRKSFAAWQQLVEGHSLPWQECELESAVEIRRALVEIVLRRAEELARLNDELQKSNIELDSFAYIASHDLKEPLRGIHNYSHILKRSLGDRLRDDETRRLDTIMRLTQRMDDLIESLLQYSRVGRVDLLLKPTDLHEVLQQVLEMLRPRLEQSHTTVAVLGHLPRMMADRVRVSEVFSNLISNATKYSNRDQRMVEVGCKPGVVPVFYVQDNGIGIEPEHHADIFGIFKRLHGREEYGGGTGAGLTITKKVIERHGGRIWVESTPGEGSTFYFTLTPEGGGKQE